MTDDVRSMQMTWTWARLESFTAVQWHQILQARAEVFVVEQRCAYQDPDGLDAHAWHLQVLQDGQLVALPGWWMRAVNTPIRRLAE